MKKVVRIDEHAFEELSHFPDDVRVKFQSLFIILERDGQIREPYGKKIDRELFELRVKVQGQWRGLYAYLGTKEIIILCAFQKKTQKTPLKLITTAKKRLRRYV